MPKRKTYKRKKKSKKRKTYKKRHSKTRKQKTKHRKSNSEPKYKVEKCAPKNKKDILGFTCYTPASLHKMKSIWNTKHPDAKIVSNNPKTIWENLRYIFKNTCKKKVVGCVINV